MPGNLSVGLIHLEVGSVVPLNMGIRIISPVDFDPTRVTFNLQATKYIYCDS